MSVLIKEMGEIVRALLLNPKPVELAALCLVAAVSFMAVMRLTAEPFELRFATWPRVIMVFAIGTGLSLLAVAVARVYLLPHLEIGQAPRIAVQIGAAVVVVLAVMLPLQSWLQKGNYLQCLLSTLVAIVAAVLITTMLSAGWHMVAQGRLQMDKTRDRKDAIESDLMKVP